MIKLDIFSDPICPWCYIGKTYLDRALEQAPDHPFTIEWHPFQLNPSMPIAGMDRGEYLARKFGGREGATAVYSRIEDAARSAGIEIDFAKIARTPNTLDAHRLIHWAGLEGHQSAVVAALFRAYFRDGRDIGTPEVLADIGVRHGGLDPAVAAQLLAGEADRAEIAARDEHARGRGISAVPTFIIAGQYVVQGAQPAETWQQIIAEIGAATGQGGEAAASASESPA